MSVVGLVAWCHDSRSESNGWLDGGHQIADKRVNKRRRKGTASGAESGVGLMDGKVVCAVMGLAGRKHKMSMVVMSDRTSLRNPNAGRPSDDKEVRGPG